jgi:hypothetical protein
VNADRMFKWKRLHEPRFLAQRLNRGPKLPPICVAEKSLGVPGDRGLDSKSDPHRDRREGLVTIEAGSDPLWLRVPRLHLLL